MGRVIPRKEAEQAAEYVRGMGLVFTNGCFDLLHGGHIYTLRKAKEEGGVLFVGLNSDSSVRRLKGEGRPIMPEAERAEVLSALEMVDGVVIFDEDTPLELIKELRPQVLVKGGDYTVEQVAGAKEMLSWGGRVVIIPYLEGYSTTNILQRLYALNRDNTG
jgi:rfaE bifunctional protein nucleotidyltransferase chain/domain